MSKSIKKEKVSKGRNLDMLGMILADKGGSHKNKRDKRAGNPKNHWSQNDQEAY